jgi:hypothetical protein
MRSISEVDKAALRFAKEAMAAERALARRDQNERKRDEAWNRAIPRQREAS